MVQLTLTRKRPKRLQTTRPVLFRKRDDVKPEEETPRNKTCKPNEQNTTLESDTHATNAADANEFDGDNHQICWAHKGLFGDTLDF